MANYDIIGNIAIIKGEDKSKKEISEIAEKLLKNPNVKTIVEKVDRFKGRLRTIKVKHLLGEKTLETEYKENNCIFKLNIETCYFSPRLSNERLEIAKMIKPKDKVLVMFAGVSPFSIVIAKNSKSKKITSVELGRECCRYAKENIKLNKVEDRVSVIQGDVKKQIPKLKEKFDFVIMPRPNLKESFLQQGLKVSKKGTKIIYYGFGRASELKKLTENLKKEAFKLKRKIKILGVKEAGDIAPYKFRYRIEIKVNK